jgi:hypothetical protein
MLATVKVGMFGRSAPLVQMLVSSVSPMKNSRLQNLFVAFTKNFMLEKIYNLETRSVYW